MSFCEINAVKKQLKITGPEPKLPDPQSFTNRAALHRAYDDYQNELASLRGKISAALSFSEEDISYLEADRRRGCKTIKLRFAIYVLEREGFYHRPTSQGGLAGFYESALEVFYTGNHDASAIDIIPGRYLMIRRSLNSFYANAFILGRVNIWKDIDSNGDDFYRYRTYYEYTQEGLKRTRKSEGCIFNYQENARMMGGVEYTHVDETEFKQRPEAKKAQSKSNEDSVPTCYPEQYDLHTHRGSPSVIRGLHGANYPFLRIPVSTRMMLYKLEHREDEDSKIREEEDLHTFWRSNPEAEGGEELRSFEGVLKRKDMEEISNEFDIDFSVLDNQLEMTYSKMLSP